MLALPAQQEDLYAAPTGDLAPKKARRDHAAVVADQHIAWTQVLRQVAKATVMESARSPFHHQQSGRIARLHRRLRDAFGGKFVVKLGESHKPLRSAR
jgi:hypothetical protein